MTRLFPVASRLGFGCASLGSRVGAERADRAVALALDLGVNWFDVAPSYGDGRAEALLGRALKGRRQAVHICTKYGIAPPRVSPLGAWARPFARIVAAKSTALRRVAGRARGVATRQPITPDLIASSLERSLASLGTDYVDVLALHDPDPDDLQRDDVWRAFEQAVASGKARAIGVAGSAETAATARAGDRIAELTSKRPAGDLLVVTHSVFSGAEPEVAGAAGPTEENRLEKALAANPGGIVLVSMFSPARIRRNVDTLNELEQRRG